MSRELAQGMNQPTHSRVSNPGDTRRPKAPRLIVFDGMEGGALLTSKWSWRWLRYGLPNRGDWYLSGALPAGYKAKQHLTTEYHIIEPIGQYVRRSRWVPKSQADGPEGDE